MKSFANARWPLVLFVLATCPIAGGCEIATYVDTSLLDTSTDGGIDAGKACHQVSDCPQPQYPSCATATCLASGSPVPDGGAGACGFRYATAGHNSPCALSDGGSGNCDGVGVCVPETCVDGYQDGDETAVDCGGSLCPKRCGVQQGCLVGSDCTQGVCDKDSHTCS